MIDLLCAFCNRENVRKDIAIAVLKAFNLLEKMDGSQKNLLDILTFGRDLYCKGHASTDYLKLWPTTWSACAEILKDFGYKEPITYFICLNDAHPHLWSLMKSSSDLCQYCQKPGLIQYHYLKLADKVQRWCSNKDFCSKMTYHWLYKDKWMQGPGSNVTYDEIWDGSRFSELSWFWNREKQWILPVRCTFCSKIVGTEEIRSAMQRMSLSTCASTLPITCPYCFTKFNHIPRYARGDPRNLALIGHFDGWQPFNSSVKHSCGEFIEYFVAT